MTVCRYLTTKIIQIGLQCSIVSLTVCDLSRLKSAILVPEAMHTVTNSRVKTASSLSNKLYTLTVRVLDALLLLGGFGDDLDAARKEGPDLQSVRVEHLHGDVTKKKYF